MTSEITPATERDLRMSRGKLLRAAIVVRAVHLIRRHGHPLAVVEAAAGVVVYSAGGSQLCLLVSSVDVRRGLASPTHVMLGAQLASVVDCSSMHVLRQ